MGKGVGIMWLLQIFWYVCPITYEGTIERDTRVWREPKLPGPRTASLLEFCPSDVGTMKDVVLGHSSHLELELELHFPIETAC